ncbi:tail spike protein, partial [Salmonella enterica]
MLQFRNLLSIFSVWDCFNVWADIGIVKDRPGDYSLSDYAVHQLPTILLV